MWNTITATANNQYAISLYSYQARFPVKLYVSAARSANMFLAKSALF